MNVGAAADEEPGETPGVAAVQLHDDGFPLATPTNETTPPELPVSFTPVTTGAGRSFTTKKNENGADVPSLFVAVTVPLYLPLAVTVNVGAAADEEAGETPGVVVVQLHDVALLS